MEALHAETRAISLPGSAPAHPPTSQISIAALHTAPFSGILPEWLSSILTVPKSSVLAQKSDSSVSLPSSRTSRRQKDPPWQSTTFPTKRRHCSQGRTGVFVAGHSASVSSSSRSSSGTKNGSTSPDYQVFSISNLCHDHSTVRPCEIGNEDRMAKLSNVSDDPLERGSKIFWKYKKRQTVVSHSKKAAVSNAIEDLYNLRLWML